MPLRPLLAAALIGTMTTALLAGCGGGGDDAPAPTPAPPAPAAADWSAVDRIAATAFAGASNVTGFTLAIYDRSDRRVFVKNYGDFAPDRRVPVASASKMVSGTVIFRLIGQGRLSLDSTTGQVLGWTGPRGAITLRHLLSFTSGLTPDADCTANALITLAQCVDRVRDDPAAHPYPPGTVYEYGSTHLHVAARMAEVVTGKSWNAIFDDELRIPLGLPPEVTYYTFPQQGLGRVNPLVAGGMQASLDEYAALLAIPFHRGSYRGTQWAPATLFDQQAVEPYPNVQVLKSPFTATSLSSRYGLAAWLDCNTPAAGCSVLSSPGAFGWTPWFDRDAGYYAIIGIYGSSSGSFGVTPFTVNLAQQLKPEIRRALGG